MKTIFEKTFVYPIRVQFEDVDYFGVLHHPVYLKLLERARSELFLNMGVSLHEFHKEGQGILISDVFQKFLRPAFLGKEIFVLTRVGALKQASIRFNQSVVDVPPTEEFLKSSQIQPLEALPGTLYWSELRTVCVELKNYSLIKIPQSIKNLWGIPQDEKELPKEFTDIRLHPHRRTQPLQ
jgi:YbgC/YbaW family acyl-CoA thioester hydrolase